MSKLANHRARLLAGAMLPLAAAAALAAGSASPALANGHSFEVVYSFAGGNDGVEPFSNLIKDQAGNLYGTTQIGGRDCSGLGCGTIFEIAPDGTETVLYAFSDRRKDGNFPDGGLLEDSAGNFYGTTVGGGTHGLGTVFRLAPDGTNTTLHSFNLKAGYWPRASLIADGEGNLYGTTSLGGDTQGCNSGSGCGVLFELAPDGTETVLHKFTGGSDGALPLSGLLRIAGNFYGTTQYGGGGACTGTTSGCGIVFELAKGKGHSWTEKVLYAFQGGTDGFNPIGTLIADSAGNLYGTTAQGGNSGCVDGCGTVFKLAPDGTETVLYAFPGGDGGAAPVAGVIVDKGNLYGTTEEGGASNDGTVFSLAPDGTLTTLHSFAGSDGEYPGRGALLEVGPYLYGTTVDGGSAGDGVVFRVRK
ncbi:MAG: choice-of-anchor tandem repeat GloVer-containing protein [Rhizomicrobium sp.]